MGKVFSPRAVSSATLQAFAEPAGADSSSSANSSKKPIKVTFSPSPVKTGYRTDVSPSPIKVTVTATLEPKSETKNITFAKEGADRFSYTEVSRDESKGEIKLDVKGTSATPASQKDGDASLVAKDGSGAKVGEVKVIVVVPKSVGTPHPQKLTPAEMTVSPSNQVADATTSPAYVGLPPGKVHLWTTYTQWLTIKVLDQFGDALDAIYAGSPVSEIRQAMSVPINQNMAADGTYQDPVGPGLAKATDPDVDAGSAAATSWPSDPTVPLTLFDTGPMTISVSVGGHTLSPGIFNRKVRTIPPNWVKVIWP